MDEIQILELKLGTYAVMVTEWVIFLPKHLQLLVTLKAMITAYTSEIQVSVFHSPFGSGLVQYIIESPTYRENCTVLKF